MWLWKLKERGSFNIYLSPYIKALEFGTIPNSLHVGSGTWKNSQLHTLNRLWDPEEQSKRSEVRVVILFSLYKAWDYKIGRTYLVKFIFNYMKASSKQNSPTRLAKS